MAPLLLTPLNKNPGAATVPPEIKNNVISLGKTGKHSIAVTSRYCQTMPPKKTKDMWTKQLKPRQ